MLDQSNGFGALARRDGLLRQRDDTLIIDRIEPVGNYAVCLYFDDEHNTGIYSWETLYSLGVNHEANWRQYLEELRAAGHPRKEQAS